VSERYKVSSGGGVRRGETVVEQWDVGHCGNFELGVVVAGRRRLQTEMPETGARIRWPG
jgi:hypothetical protein